MTPTQIAAALRQAFAAGQGTSGAIQAAANAHPEVTLPQLRKAFAIASADPVTAMHAPLPYKRLR